MAEGKRLFLELLARLDSRELFREILRKQLWKFYVQSGKTDWMEAKTVRTLYESVELKMQTSRGPSDDPAFWSDNEKKVFIWFVIFHSYFLAEEGKQLDHSSWIELSPVLFHRDPRYLHFQYLNLCRPLEKIAWSGEQDQLLRQAVRTCEAGKWNDVSKLIFFQSDLQLYKSAKHCRERWLNHLDDKKKHGNWSPQEDLEIFKFVLENGKKWCKLVPILQEARTEHMVKNRFNSLMCKMKRSKKQKDETLMLKIVRQLKKQLSNMEKRKLKRQQRNRMGRGLGVDEQEGEGIEGEQEPVPFLKAEEEPVSEHSKSVGISQQKSPLSCPDKSIPPSLLSSPRKLPSSHDSTLKREEGSEDSRVKVEEHSPQQQVSPEQQEGSLAPQNHNSELPPVRPLVYFDPHGYGYQPWPPYYLPVPYMPYGYYA